MNVFLTVDVELWPDSWSSLGERSSARSWQKYILGETAKGSYGLPFQLELLNRHSLKATFFVETLFSELYGRPYLADLVGMIQDAGQDVQLHVHTEWMNRKPGVLDKFRWAINLHEYSLAEQTDILAWAKARLMDCGARGVVAFRAGNYGADSNTLAALARNSILIDSSHNSAYANRGSVIASELGMQLSDFRSGVLVLPVTCFTDGLSRLRHMQITSCSTSEIEQLLLQGEKQGKNHCVVVSHGFEFLKASKSAPDRFAIRRFERLCEFLDHNRDRFPTSYVRDAASGYLPCAGDNDGLRTSRLSAIQRYGEQLLKRMV